MASRIDSTEQLVFEAFRTKLATGLSLSASQHFVTVMPEMLPTNTSGIIRPSGVFYTVSPGPSAFHPDEQALTNVTEQWSISVTIWTPIKTDSDPDQVKLLFDSTRGLYPLKRALIRAMLTSPDLVINVGGDVALREVLSVSDCGQPGFDSQNGYGFLTLGFPVSFDLSSAD